LNISAGIANNDEISKFLIRTPISYIDMFLRRRRWLEKNVYAENEDFDLNSFFSIKSGFVRGTLGNPKYFSGMKNDLRKEFILKEKSPEVLRLLEDIKSSNSVSIHVRRGDLLILKNVFVLSMEYYKKAVNEIRKTVKNPRFFIFSDGIEWCKENFKWLNNVVFVSNEMAVEDFELMRNCNHHILANSSLSWWVGYLRESNKEKVICPAHFGAWSYDPKKNFILKNWKKI